MSIPRLVVVLLGLAACATPAGDDPALELDAGVAPSPDAAPAPDVDAAVDAAPVEVTPIPAARPDIADGGATQLVVWDTPRNGTTDVYGARLDATGRVLDPDGIAIAMAQGTQIAPRVAWNGHVYLVVWKDNRAGHASIVGARVGSDGTLLDPGGIVIDDRGGTTQFPDVASDGTDFLVVWEGPCGASGCVHGVSGAIVTGAGAVGPARRLAATDALSYTPAVAYGGGTYLVTWAQIATNGAHDLHGRLVSPAGAAGAAIAISTATGNQIVPAIAGGSTFLVVWQDTRSGNVQTYGARVAASGAVLDAGGLELSPAGRWRDAPDVARSGDGFVISWTEVVGASDVGVCTRRVDASGVASATVHSFVAPSVGGSPLDDDKHASLAAMGDQATLVWQASWEGSSTVVGGRLGATNELVAAPTTLSTAIVRP